MTIHAVTFVYPLWLLGGLALAAAILFLGARLDRKRRLALAAFSTRRQGPHSSLSGTRRAIKRSLLVLGALLGCAALARPQWGSRWEEAHRRGLDLLFAVDTSKSMLAPDLKPDRLTRAKLAIRDLMDKFEGHRAGLVAFAGDAFLQCPLTLDRGIFDQTLDALDTSTIPRGGTDVGRAIQVARQAMSNQPAHRKLLVLLTDGEDLESRAVEAARAAAEDGIVIYTVGVGTPAGELIPQPGQPGQFVHDDKGGFVRSQLDENTLQAIARVTGGDYRRLGEAGQGLENLYHDVLAKLPQQELTSRTRQVPIERFQWPLGAAIVFFALEAVLGERRRQRPVEEPARHLPKLVQLRRRVVMMTALGLMVTASTAQASPGGAERAYREGKFKQSAEEYGRALARSPEDPKLRYNLGVAAYKSGDLAKADEALRGSLHTGELGLQESAYSDLGNVLYRAGQQSVAQHPEQTKEKWQQAIASYESALKLNTQDGDAVYNRDFVKRKLAELERQQKQQQQNQQQKDQQNKQKQDQKQNPQQNQQKQDQQKQNQQKQDQQKQNQQQQDQQKQNQQQQGKSADKPGQQGQPADQKNQQDQQNAQKQPPRPEQGEAKPAATPPETPQPSGAKPKQPAEHEPQEPEVPGQLSRTQAKQLLDSLRGDERLMPAVPAANKPMDDETVRRDW
jgi:Ca-activated chloride channel family protein